MTASLRTVTPLIPAAASVADALHFFTRELGFSVTWEGGEMAGV